MTSDLWEVALVAALALNAVLGFGYRLYRLTKGGPVQDVTGQAILGLLLVAVALAVAGGASWGRWVALGYGLLFGIAVMPLWVLAVLLPLRPEAIDYAFTGVYWTALVTIVVSAVAI